MKSKLRKNTAGRRFLTNEDFSAITAKKPHKPLLVSLKNNAGRSSQTGRVTTRHRGGGQKRLYRVVDFKQCETESKAKVVSIEYDPYRTAFICLVEYIDGKKAYILAPDKIQVGKELVFSSTSAPVKIGCRMALSAIPTGVAIHNLELRFQGGGKIIRSAGSSATIISHEDNLSIVKLPSGETRKIDSRCRASIGQVSNPKHSQVVIGKAGRIRWMHRRPVVRGKAMSVKAHPHGGGEGNNPIGLKYPKTKWGKPAMGVKTRNIRKVSSKFILKRRKK
ncbi:MAG: large subunit ribosomal protein L2 [Candidatus Berkelbacteria bacterium Licking1014_85]|uniref:Large ribosomal subunit protein uL2 n=1 Tax=Candidatus Berkelbacteria bacterium Licking1014_85 TaxID=2017148 RepID=A0A554LM04_9BACT|nr:MAG: large subunit ribosomal protein L2 [Candidatus Berkelbacteria bacterium Licking1014_85]